MGWTTPRTWVTDEVPTAAILNTHIRDNLNALAALGFSGSTQPGSISTSSATAIMVGLTEYMTPVATGRAVAVFVCTGSSTAANTWFIQGWYGTGTAPTGGDAVTGTAISTENRMVPSAGGLYDSIAVLGFATGLVVGTQYWFDLAFRSSGGATATVEEFTYVVLET